MAIPLFLFYLTPPDKHKNKLMGQSYFFIFRRLKSKMLFFEQHFYKQHQGEI